MKNSSKTPVEQPRLVRLSNWTEGGTGLTNFRPEEEPLYLAAIEAHGDPDYVIAHAPCPGPSGQFIPGDYSLHFFGIKRAGDSVDFWKVFRNLRANADMHAPA